MVVLLPNGVDLAFYYFGYVPNRPTNCVAIAVFGVLIILLTIRILRSRSPKILYLLPLTAILEMVGFVLRLVVADNPTIGTFTAMSVFLLVSANIMTMTNYKSIGDVVSLSDVETRYGIIGPDFSKWFIRSNVIASLFQTIGGSLQSSGNSQAGKVLVIVGASAQVVLFGFFICCTIYIRNCNDYGYHINGQNPKSKLTLVVLASMTCIIIRVVYRLQNNVEILLGFQDKEWAFYIFDGLMIAISLSIHFLFFIGNYFPLAGDIKEPASRVTDKDDVEASLYN